MIRAVVLLVLVLIPIPVLAQVTSPPTVPSTPPPLPDTKYAPPLPLTSYRIIDLNKTTQETFNLSATDNVRFVGPTLPRKTGLRINGGNHIAITGGNFAPVKTWVTGGNNMTGTIHTKQQNGSIYIEGVKIDNAKAYGSDGLTLNAAGTKLIPAIVQNTTVINVQGKEEANLAPNLRAHGDILQPQGALSTLSLYNVQGSANYQGLMLMKQDTVVYGGKVNAVILERVNLWHTGPNDNCSYLIIIGGSSKQTVSLKDVTLTRVPNGRSCKGGSVNTFPNATVTGTVTYRSTGGFLW